MAVGKVLNVQEVAERLHVHPITVYRMIKGAHLPAFRIGRVWRFNSEAVDRWLLTTKRHAFATNGRRDHPNGTAPS